MFFIILIIKYTFIIIFQRRLFYLFFCGEDKYFFNGRKNIFAREFLFYIISDNGNRNRLNYHENLLDYHELHIMHIMFAKVEKSVTIINLLLKSSPEAIWKIQDSFLSAAKFLTFDKFDVRLTFLRGSIAESN